MKSNGVPLEKSSWREIVATYDDLPLIVMAQRGREINYEGSWSVDHTKEVVEWTRKRLARGATMLVLTGGDDPLTFPHKRAEAMGLRLSDARPGRSSVVTFIDSPHIALQTWEARHRKGFQSKLMQ